MQAVIMAGGFGTRLYPLTQDTPKPMLPVGEQPLLQRIVEQLRVCGFHCIHISTFHRAEKIEEYFGDGSEFGVELKYLVEEEPLGTAGALGLLENPGRGVLVLNGDVLTEIDLRRMIRFHHDNHAALTMAVHPYRVEVPYGVVESNGHHVLGMREKPRLSFSVNAGIYVLSPDAHARVERGKRLMMSELIEGLIHDEEKVVAFPFEEYWLDIGQHEQYEQAQHDVTELKSTKTATLTSLALLGASMAQVVLNSV